MSRFAQGLVILALLSWGLGLSAQTTGPSQPVAVGYITNLVGNNNYEIDAFAANPDGSLVKIAGSPFSSRPYNSMVVNAKFLFATDFDHIDSYAIAPNGAISLVASLDVHQATGSCGGAEDLSLDRTGSYLYNLDYDADCSSNSDYDAFAIDLKTGSLTFLGGAAGLSTYWLTEPLSFLSNNGFGYSMYCSGDMYWESYVLRRNPDGTLTYLTDLPLPPPGPNDDFYCPSRTAADASGHLAITVQGARCCSNGNDATPQLATYRESFTGQGFNPILLTTDSAYDNMPNTAVTDVLDLKMSPSGKLLAVGGFGGLQVFHFNGGRPITHYTELLTDETVTSMAWDNFNHLYAITGSGHLRVYSVTPESVREAPGSPYSIAKPQTLAVLSIR